MTFTRSFFPEALRSVLPLAILGAGVAGFAALASQREPPSREMTEEPVPLVETAPVTANSSGLRIEVDGLVVPYREVTLAAEVAGRVATKSPNCRAGQYVTQGTPLFEIDPRDYELEVKRLELELEQAQANLRELEVDTENTRALLKLVEEELVLEQRQLARTREVFKRGALTESNLDEALRAELQVRNNLRTQRNQLNSQLAQRARLEQAIQLAEAKLAEAKLDLARTKVVAPLDGVVVEDLVEENSYVQPGTQMIKIEDTSAVEVRCNLRMEELRWIWQQKKPASTGRANRAARDYQLPHIPVTVSYRVGDRRYNWEGVLSHYDGIGLDERTRTVPCRILVPRPRQAQAASGANPLGGDAIDAAPFGANAGPPALLRGMYVTVHMRAQPDRQLLRVPERAIRPGNVVWRLVDGKLSVEHVKVARLVEDAALIEAGSALKADQRVIVSPLAVAVDGMAVREKNVP